MLKTEGTKDNNEHPFPPLFTKLTGTKSKKVTLGERQECGERLFLRKRYIGKCKADRGANTEKNPLANQSLP